MWKCIPSTTLLLALLFANASAQQVTGKKLPPATLSPEPYILLNTVVTEQWPATLEAVNAPADMHLLNPGQCIRVAVLASGTGYEHFLDNTSIGFTVHSSDKDIPFPLTQSASTKRVKPEGGDLVTAALAAAGIKQNPFFTTAVMSASAASWCVPANSSDGSIEIRAVVKRGESETKLKPKTVTIESIETATKKVFKDENEFGPWVMNYHQSPEPGRLIPAIVFFASSKQDSPNTLEFFKAAFQHDGTTAQAFGPSLGRADKLSQMLALTLLSKAGVQLTQPPTLSDEDSKLIASALDLPDPYEMKPTREIGSSLDCLWADFFATGQIKPVTAISSALAWQADYDSFPRLVQSGKKPITPTESIYRGVGYSAAGWSLSSFQRSDPLVADYIQVIAANPATSDAIKKELAGLESNPAFKHQ
jgi:hypothetical protein